MFPDDVGAIGERGPGQDERVIGTGAARRSFVPAWRDLDPRLLTRARGEGRIRGTTLQLLGAMLDNPAYADPTLRRGLREARHLHSAERRLVSELSYDFLRFHALAAEAFGPGPERFYTAWLDAQMPEVGSHDALSEAFSLQPPTAENPATRSRWLTAAASVPPERAIAILGSVSAAFAAELSRIESPLALLAASNARAPLVLRANTLRTHRENLAIRLEKEGLPTIPSALAPDGLIAQKAADLHTLQSFRDGWFEVQDEGSQLLGALLTPPAGAARPRFVDYCAGAGGKTLQIAAAWKNKAEILALDTRSRPLEALRERAQRAGVLGLYTDILDPALAPDPRRFTHWLGSADAVLVDAPCSGSGTLRRHPELRWRIDQDFLDNHCEIQRQVLAHASGFVRPGGQLVYATCSVLHRENEDIVGAFLDTHNNFSATNLTLSMRPDRDRTDGFFAQVLHRRSC